MVKQIKATHRSRFVLQEIANLQPGLSSAVSVSASLFKFLLIEFTTGNLLQLFNSLIKLSANVFNIALMNFYCIIVGNINHYQRNIMHTSNILIPFGHAVTNIVAAQYKIRLRHNHLTIALYGCCSAFFFRTIRQGCNFV